MRPVLSRPVIGLPPHLHEICDLLARGMVRLRRRSIEESARQARADGESSLHFTPAQSGHAEPTGLETA
jgi:hypothetical protein